MHLVKTKVTFAVVGVLAVISAVVAANLSFWTATILACLVVFPPIVMLWYRTRSRQTMSESIQEALR